MSARVGLASSRGSCCRRPADVNIRPMGGGEGKKKTASRVPRPSPATTGKRRVVSRRVVNGGLLAPSAHSDGDDDRPSGAGPETVWGAVLRLSAELDVEAEPLAPEELARLDQSPDRNFYDTPCFAQHVDDGFLCRLTELYRQVLRPGSRVLDLCGSFDSHLPSQDSLALGHITGHGMNDAELAANPRLDQFFILDLNSGREIVLPMQPGQVDAILCCCGIQYLTRPTAVLRECKRVLSPGGLIAISFSSHSWEEKATAGWLARSDEQRKDLVESFLSDAGFTDIRSEVSSLREKGPPDGDAPRAISDPFVAVIARHPAVPAAAGLAQAEQEGFHQTKANSVLMETSLLVGAAGLADGSADGGQRASPATLQRWVSAFESMRQEAIQMGIPRAAVPELPEDPNPEDIRTKRELLSGMIASFLSADI